MSESTDNIVKLAEHYWSYWDRHHSIPDGCIRQSWEKPNFYVCASRLSASKEEVRDAHKKLLLRFQAVRVNSHSPDGKVVDHDFVSDNAAYWTLEYGMGCAESGDDRLRKECFAIAINNERA